MFTVLFGAVTFGTNLSRLVDDPSSYGTNFDVGLGQGGDGIGPTVEQALRGSPDVAGLTLYGTTSIVIGSRSLAVIGMRPVTGDLTPDLLDGRLPAADDEMVLGPVAARQLGLHVGERLDGKAASGRSFLITGIGLIPGVDGADELGRVALVNEAGLVAIDPAATASFAAIDIAPAAPPGAQERIATATGFEVGQLDPPADIVNLKRVRSIPAVVAASVGVLGVLSLGHLMLTGVRRRRRDFAVLCAVGAPRRWLGDVVHWQTSFTSVAVLVVAAPLGTMAGASLYRRFATNLGGRPDAVLPLGSVAVLLAGLLILTNLVAAVPARQVRRDIPATVLASS